MPDFLSIIPLIFILAMITLGSVLLVHFFMGNASRTMRVFVATTSGPASLLLMAFPFWISIMDGPSLLGLAFALLILTICGLLGWPIAYFATKRLDQVHQSDMDAVE